MIFSPLADTANAKLLKAYAPGYQASAQWTTIYEGQTAKLSSGAYTWEITIALTAQ